jgi:hypothetical protein
MRVSPITGQGFTWQQDEVDVLHSAVILLQAGSHFNSLGDMLQDVSATLHRPLNAVRTKYYRLREAEAFGPVKFPRSRPLLSSL